MQFINQAPLYKIIKVTGPKHNLLGLELCSAPIGELAIEALDPAGKSVDRVSADDVRRQVLIGIEKAKIEIGREFHIRRIQYIRSDTPSSEVYCELTLEILKRIEAIAQVAE